MDVVFKMLPDGGFVAGDRGSEMTSYAYPSSPHAIVARTYPKLVAEEMIEGERMSYRTIPAVQEYDRKNWLLISGTDKQSPPSAPAEDSRKIRSSLKLSGSVMAHGAGSNLKMLQTANAEAWGAEQCGFS